MATAKKGASGGAKKATGQAAKVKADHAKTGRPVSPTEDPTSHKTTGAALASQVDPKGTSGATVNAKTVDDIAAVEAEKQKADEAAVDNSLLGRIAKKGFFFVRDHTTGVDYVGASPQNDPDASEASKLRSGVFPLSQIAPRTGMLIRLEKGNSFQLGEGFGPETNPGDWQRVTTPDGKPLFG
jgi:hypothetical protein